MKEEESLNRGLVIISLQESRLRKEKRTRRGEVKGEERGRLK